MSISYNKKPISAIAVFDGKIKGTVYFTESKNEVIIDIDLKGLNKSSLDKDFISKITKNQISKKFYIYFI